MVIRFDATSTRYRSDWTSKPKPSQPSKTQSPRCLSLPPLARKAIQLHQQRPAAAALLESIIDKLLANQRTP